MKNQNTLIVVALCIVVFAILFYWFAYRPSQIRSQCAKAMNHSSFTVEMEQYTKCIHEHGL